MFEDGAAPIMILPKKSISILVGDGSNEIKVIPSGKDEAVDSKSNVTVSTEDLLDKIKDENIFNIPISELSISSEEFKQIVLFKGELHYDNIGVKKG
jgi:hypothetical protein